MENQARNSGSADRTYKRTGTITTEVVIPLLQTMIIGSALALLISATSWLVMTFVLATPILTTIKVSIVAGLVPALAISCLILMVRFLHEVSAPFRRIVYQAEERLQVDLDSDGFVGTPITEADLDRAALQVLRLVYSGKKYTRGEATASLSISQDLYNRTMSRLQIRGVIQGRRQGKTGTPVYPTIAEAWQEYLDASLKARQFDVGDRRQLIART